jgi:AcrR family transcriptional regulator
MRPRRTQAQIREAIVTAARELVEHASPDSVTTRAIAERAGVQQSVIYRYFGSRDAVFRELINRNIGQLKRTVAEHADIVDGLWAAYEFYSDHPETLLSISRMVANGRVADVHAMEEDADVSAPMMQVLQFAVRRRTNTDDPELQADYVLVTALLAGMATLAPYLEGIRAVRGVDHDLVQARLRTLVECVIDGTFAAPVAAPAGELAPTSP